MLVLSENGLQCSYKNPIGDHRGGESHRREIGALFTTICIYVDALLTSNEKGSLAIKQ